LDHASNTSCFPSASEKTGFRAVPAVGTTQKQGPGASAGMASKETRPARFRAGLVQTGGLSEMKGHRPKDVAVKTARSITPLLKRF